MAKTKEQIIEELKVKNKEYDRQLSIFDSNLKKHKKIAGGKRASKALHRARSIAKQIDKLKKQYRRAK
jgi:hypothetical protein